MDKIDRIRSFFKLMSGHDVKVMPNAKKNSGGVLFVNNKGIPVRFHINPERNFRVTQAVILHEIGHMKNKSQDEWNAHRWALQQAQKRRWWHIERELISQLASWKRIPNKKYQVAYRRALKNEACKNVIIAENKRNRELNGLLLRLMKEDIARLTESIKNDKKKLLRCKKELRKWK